jgi:hypothetical protein
MIRAFGSWGAFASGLREETWTCREAVGLLQLRSSHEVAKSAAFANQPTNDLVKPLEVLSTIFDSTLWQDITVMSLLLRRTILSTQRRIAAQVTVHRTLGVDTSNSLTPFAGHE